MKNIYYILFFMLLLTPLAYGADEIAIPVEGLECTDWERAADARIWSEEVVSGFRKGSSKRFPLNALCDESAFHEIKEIKRLSLEIITNDICSGAGSREGALALKIYKKAEEYFPVSDCIESRIILEFESLPQGERSPVPAGFGSSGYPETPLLLSSACAGVTVNTGGPELKKPSLIPGKLDQGCLIHKSGLKLDALWDREETDYYRIFLYIRDADRIKRLSVNIIFPSFHLSLLPDLYFFRLKLKTELLSIPKFSLIKSLKYFRLFLYQRLCRCFRSSIACIVRAGENSSPCKCHDRRIPWISGLSVNNKPESIIPQGVLS